MKMKKGTIWLIGVIIIAIYGIGGFIFRMEPVILSSLSSIVAVVFIGLGAQVGDSIQRSALYRQELDKKDE